MISAFAKGDTMNTWQSGDVLDAAVQTLINDRCRRAYLHDMRGSLQAVYLSLEALARSAKHGAQNSALIDSASSIAKRAMANHEQTLVDIVNQVTGPDDAPANMDLAALVKQTQQFLRNDALGRGITLSVSGDEEVMVFTQRNKLRSLLLGLHTLGIDALPAGTELHVDLRRADGYALLELRSDLTYDAIREARDLLCHEPLDLRPQELVLGFARQWISAHGGRLEIDSASGAQGVLRLYYPLVR
jgi:signal transduction histidine kinase